MISVTILTKNSAETLEATLQSVTSFPEVILYDTGSTDETLSIGKKFSNVKIVKGEFEGFGRTHNAATASASYDFIFSLDSDEVLTPELSEEILGTKLDSSAVYAILRKNYFQGKHIKGCAGWHPDWVTRLYHRKKTSFDSAEVHEKIIQGPLERICFTHSMHHVPYRQISDFLQKMQSYSSLFAKQNKGKKKASFLGAILHGWAAFIKSYFLKRGIFLGEEGFLISLYNGQTAFYKYLKLREENKK